MYIKVRVIAGSKEESVKKIKDDSFKISVREPAERNLANGRVIEIVRGQFPQAKIVRIVNGHNSPHKLISID